MGLKALAAGWKGVISDQSEVLGPGEMLRTFHSPRRDRPDSLGATECSRVRCSLNNPELVHEPVTIVLEKPLGLNVTCNRGPAFKRFHA